MAENTLPEMAPGGAWLASSSDREPHYVVGEAHIKRLLSEGWQIAADPRDPAKFQTTAAKPSIEDALRAELEQMKAQIVAMMAQAVAPVAPADTATSDDSSKPKRGKA